MSTDGIGNVMARATSTGSLTSDSVHMTGVAVAGTANEGRVTIKNGNTNGNIQFDIDTPGNNGFEQFKSFDIPCPDGIYVDTVNNVRSITVFWRKT